MPQRQPNANKRLSSWPEEVLHELLLARFSSNAQELRIAMIRFQ
jgi:hypothetical protein